MNEQPAGLSKERMQSLVDERRRLKEETQRLSDQMIQLKRQQKKVDEDLMNMMESTNTHQLCRGGVALRLTFREQKKPWRESDLSSVLSEQLGPDHGERVLEDLEAKRPIKQQRYILQCSRGRGSESK